MGIYERGGGKSKSERVLDATTGGNALGTKNRTKRYAAWLQQFD